mgnify:CR=1 FL=1
MLSSERAPRSRRQGLLLLLLLLLLTDVGGQPRCGRSSRINSSILAHGRPHFSHTFIKWGAISAHPQLFFYEFKHNAS